MNTSCVLRVTTTVLTNNAQNTTTINSVIFEQTHGCIARPCGYDKQDAGRHHVATQRDRTKYAGRSQQLGTALALYRDTENARGIERAVFGIAHRTGAAARSVCPAAVPRAGRSMEPTRHSLAPQGGRVSVSAHGCGICRSLPMEMGRSESRR